MQEALRVGRVEPLRSELDRRLDELRPRHAPEAAVRILEPGDEARDGDRARADVVALGRVAEVDGDVLDLAERLRGGGEEAVEHGRLAVDPGEEEAAAGGTGQRALGDSGGERGCDAGVDGVSALREHARAGLGGGAASGGDRSLHEVRVKMLYGCR